jgi:hypothetical protein
MTKPFRTGPNSAAAGGFARYLAHASV